MIEFAGEAGIFLHDHHRMVHYLGGWYFLSQRYPGRRPLILALKGMPPVGRAYL